MNLLVYFGHPAHFHLFKEAIKNVQAKGVSVTIVIKSKDMLEQLLKDSGLPYINITGDITNTTGRFNTYKNFFTRLRRLSGIIRRSKAQLLIGSAAELAVLGQLFRIPAYVFFEDDFEAVKKFAKIAGPAATKLICPECCSAWKWNDKKVGYKSYHELAYLHPNHFAPDFEKVKAIFKPGQKHFILRFAQLTAYHDVGKSGIDTRIAQQLIDLLSPHGQIYITSERPLEPQFEQYRIRISPLDIHHALYFADMYIGDSQTMTAEAAVLGTPSVRFNDFVGELSYLEELEHKFQLTKGVRTNDPKKLLETVKSLLEIADLKAEWERRRKQMLSQCIDLSQLMTEMIMEVLGPLR